MFINEVRLSGRAFKDAERKGNGPFRFAIVQGGGKKKDSEERLAYRILQRHRLAEHLPRCRTGKKGRDRQRRGKIEAGGMDRQGWGEAQVLRDRRCRGEDCG